MLQGITSGKKGSRRNSNSGGLYPRTKDPNSMRVSWIVFTLSILASMAALMIVMSQDQGQNVVNDLEASLVKLNSELEKKKTENDACQAEKKTKSEELAAKENEKIKTEATLKLESDTWNSEINKLQAELTTYTPICDYVKRPNVSEIMWQPNHSCDEGKELITSQ
ncbi:hypothetical protein Q5P01_018420 [Channa striata]|uniref:Uncharacterized protein n=1 Tax=Channa striata TaxID=64152 RepID=A0AA88M4V9_CHASR|nr:hypothetical protein Q5P01_018420 [Channa striata]